MDLRRYENLKSEVERLERESAKVEGALGEVMERMKSEFDCGTLKESNKKIKELETELAELEEQFENDVERFEAKLKACQNGSD